MAASAVQSQSRSLDFCNSFWGPGNDGANILLSRMRVATKTTEEIRRFWIERAAIEEQYANRLRELSKFPMGTDEIGELRKATETLRKETETQAQMHSQLAQSIKSVLEMPTSHLFARQANHRKNYQAPVEKKLRIKQNQESFLTKSRERYEGDCLRIMSYTQQCSFAQGKDLERVQTKLKRSQQSSQASEKELEDSTQTLHELLHGWEADWKEFCDRSQDLEEDRLEFMLNTLWSYANEVSQLCVNDDQSCERIRTTLEHLEPTRELSQFISEYGTGDSIVQPQPFVPFDPQNPAAASQPTASTRSSNYARVSRRASPSYNPLQPKFSQKEVPLTDPVLSKNYIEANGQNHRPSTRLHNSTRSGSREPPPTGPPTVAPPPVPDTYLPPPIPTTLANSQSQRQRTSQPLPTPQHSRRQDQLPMPSQSPPLPLFETETILFYVRALFDYTATIDEEFSFQAGDIIAVTATPDDGWWSGELLDELRKEPGRHVFPSNFVELF